MLKKDKLVQYEEEFEGLLHVKTNQRNDEASHPDKREIQHRDIWVIG